eukprot:Nk52_evm75s2192 gene=Nk52_evmTU75s2192
MDADIAEVRIRQKREREKELRQKEAEALVNAEKNKARVPQGLFHSPPDKRKESPNPSALEARSQSMLASVNAAKDDKDRIRDYGSFFSPPTGPASAGAEKKENMKDSITHAESEKLNSKPLPVGMSMPEAASVRRPTPLKPTLSMDSANGDPEAIVQMMTKNITTPMSGMTSPGRPRGFSLCSPLHSMMYKDNPIINPNSMLSPLHGNAEDEEKANNTGNHSTKKESQDKHKLEDLGLSMSDDSDDETPPVKVAAKGNGSAPVSLSASVKAGTTVGKSKLEPAVSDSSVSESDDVKQKNKNENEAHTAPVREPKGASEKSLLVKIPISKLERGKRKQRLESSGSNNKRSRNSLSESDKGRVSSPAPGRITPAAVLGTKAKGGLGMGSDSSGEGSGRATPMIVVNHTSVGGTKTEGNTSSQRAKTSSNDLISKARSLKHATDKLVFKDRRQKSLAYIPSAMYFIRGCEAHEKEDTLSKELIMKVYDDTIQYLHHVVFPQRNGLNLLGVDKARASLCMKCIGVLYYRVGSAKIDSMRRLYNEARALDKYMSKKDVSPNADAKGKVSASGKDRGGKNALSPSAANGKNGTKTSPFDESSPVTPSFGNELSIPVELVGVLQRYLKYSSYLMKATEIWRNSVKAAQESKNALVIDIPPHISLLSSPNEIADYTEEIVEKLNNSKE